MSKRNKKFRSNRSAFKLEALEQRQLLATIVGGSGGTEVGSDITVGGKVYDQILMTGSSVSVTADAGQITRVDFLDADGDIVRAELSGSGTLNISLANFAAAATPTKYAISGTKYVSGLASFTITNSDATTNFTTTSLGPLGPAAAFQGLLNPIFANGTLIGGNNTANVARLVIVGDSTNLVGGAGTAFGTVNAANAIFGDSSGVVGIYAPNTSFKSGSTITIGDIVPVGTTATPILSLGLFSDVKTVTVAGGKLASVSGGVAYTLNNISSLASTTGTNSNGVKLATLPLSNGATIATYSSGLGTVTIDGSTATTASLDALYKTAYLQDVVVNNGLAAGVILRAYQFGNVTVNGDLAGVITTDVDSDNISDNAEVGIGNVTITGSIVNGGYIESSTTIGNVEVKGGITHTSGSATITVNGNATVPDQIAVISTLGRSGLSAAIGNVTVTGDIALGTSTTPVAEGLISANRSLLTTNIAQSVGSTGGIGNISGANLTAYTSLATTTAQFPSTAAGIISLAGPSGQSIGTVTFTGDVLVNNTVGAGFISSARNIGAISVKSLNMNVPAAAGIVTTANNGNVGAISSTGTGGITVVQGIISANGTGSVGAINVSGTGNLYLGASTGGVVNNNTSGISGGSVGSITVTGGHLTTGTSAAITATAGNVGAITLTAGTLTVNKAITATGGNVGDITLTDTSGTISKINAPISATTVTGVGGAIGNILVTKGSLTLDTNVQDGGINAATTLGNITLSNGNLLLNTAKQTVVAGTSIGNISVAGNITITGAGAGFKVGTGAAAGNAIGNITVTGGSITGTNLNVEFQANTIGNVSVTGAAATATLLKDVIFAAKGTTQATIASAKIGNITLNSSANATGDIADATAASTTANTGTGFSSSGSIGNVSITTGNSAGAEVVSSAGNTGNLVIRAGNSNMGKLTNLAGTTATALVGDGVAVNTTSGATTSENVDSVSIGDVTISALVPGGKLSKANGSVATAGVAGTGLMVISGVNNVNAGVFKTAAAAAATVNSATPSTVLTGGNIGAVSVSDLAGLVVKTPFSTATLTIKTTDDGAGGSVIMGDKISSITVNSGPGAILSLTSLSGLPLKGALGSATGIPDGTKQEYVGNDVDNLVIVVL